MRLSRRSFLYAGPSAAAFAVISRATRAQTYPARPVRVIVPFGSAGATDIVARLIAQWLSERLGQQFIIDNRPGAGSNLGTEVVIRSAPDGYTLLLVGPPAAINATLYEKLSFNFMRDIAPVAGIVRFPNVMVVNPALPVTTVPELIAYAKSNPGKINFASTGLGSTPHVNGELLPDTHADAAGRPYRRGNRAGVRSKRCLWSRRAHQHADRDHRRAQPGSERSARGHRNAGALCRARRHGAPRLGRRLPSVDCRRDGEVGEGCEICRRQGGLITGHSDVP